MKTPYLLAFSIAAICTSLIAQDYEIKFNRSSKVGDSYTIDATTTVNQSLEVKTKDEVLQSEKAQYISKLKGNVTVEAVDDTGGKTMFSVVIDTLTGNEVGTPEVNNVLAKGAKISVDYRNDEETIMVDGKPASEEVLAAVDMFFKSPKQMKDDEVFGTKDRKKVADSWKVNSTLAAAELTKLGMEMDAESLTGQVTLKEVKTIDETPCLMILADMSSSKVSPPLPPEINVKESKFSSRLTGLFPVDTALGCRTETVEMNYTLVGEGQPATEGPMITMKMDMSQTMEASYTPVK